jgi:hypothetical protein
MIGSFFGALFLTLTSVLHSSFSFSFSSSSSSSFFFRLVFRDGRIQTSTREAAGGVRAPAAVAKTAKTGMTATTATT